MDIATIRHAVPVAVRATRVLDARRNVATVDDLIAVAVGRGAFVEFAGVDSKVLVAVDLGGGCNLATVGHAVSVAVCAIRVLDAARDVAATVSVSSGPAENLEFAADSFDAIVIGLVLCSVKDIDQVARECGLLWELSDDLRKVYLGFGTDLEKYNGDESWTLPMPARYVIDREGTVRWASVSPDYTMRPDPVETIEALRELP